MNDYIHLSDWAKPVKHVPRLDTETTDNVEVTIACAVQALNIYYPSDLIQWKLEQGSEHVSFAVGISPILYTGPDIQM